MLAISLIGGVLALLCAGAAGAARPSNRLADQDGPAVPAAPTDRRRASRCAPAEHVCSTAFHSSEEKRAAADNRGRHRTEARTCCLPGAAAPGSDQRPAQIGSLAATSNSRRGGIASRPHAETSRAPIGIRLCQSDIAALSSRSIVGSS